MNTFFKSMGTLLSGVLLLLTMNVFAQNGSMVYSLPNTSLHLIVEAEREVYTPGPYAKYANKYLGIDVPQEKKESYQLLSIELLPFIEADQSSRFVVNLGTAASKVAASTLFKFSSQGLIILSDKQKGKPEYWRFPALTDKLYADSKGATENFTSTETTLYKSVRNPSGGYDKISVQQSQVVEKSLENKAKEAANMIFKLRKKRVEIITGDTDATFSGEALGAAVEEMKRLEDDYMTLFLGNTRSSTQKMGFDVIPSADNPHQIYVAFRFSDTNGLIVPNNVAGRPITLELIPEAKKVETEQNIELVVEPEPVSKKSSKSKEPAPSLGNITYRVPSICLVKIIDGQELLLQSRVPVYQLGETLSFPIELITK